MNTQLQKVKLTGEETLHLLELIDRKLHNIDYAITQYEQSDIKTARKPDGKRYSVWIEELKNELPRWRSERDLFKGLAKKLQGEDDD